jgi:uncharacterized protein (DUF1501 family)
MTDQANDAPLPLTHAAAGDPELLIEALACLILRGDQDALTIDVEERRRHFKTYRDGFALMIYADRATGAIRLTIVGEQALPMMEQLVDDVAAGRLDLVPEMFRPERDGAPEETS